MRLYMRVYCASICQAGASLLAAGLLLPVAAVVYLAGAPWRRDAEAAAVLALAFGIAAMVAILLSMVWLKPEERRCSGG